MNFEKEQLSENKLKVLKKILPEHEYNLIASGNMYSFTIISEYRVIRECRKIINECGYFISTKQMRHLRISEISTVVILEPDTFNNINKK